jgi:hypothetical protein
MIVRRPCRRRRLLDACAGNREQVRAVERLIALSIVGGGGLVLGRRRMPA